MICSKCHKDINIKAEKGITYEGIDDHHNPMEFFSKILNKKWEGKMYYLCRKHHRDLHDELIKIMNRIANTMVFIKSEYWVAQRMNNLQIKQAEKETYEFTEQWINKGEDKDGNQNT